MARRFRSGRGFVRPAARSMVWIGAGFVTTAIPASSGVLIATLNAAALALRPFTVVRTRLLVHWRSDQQAASEFIQGVVSFQVVTDVASAGGIGNVPNPIAESNSDFFVYQPLISEMRVIGSAAINFTDGNHIVDSKSMRKVGDSDDVVVVAENRSALGAQLAVEGRFLVKLH